MSINANDYSLDNGATLIEIKKARTFGYIVLAKTHSKYDPYVTWWATDEREPKKLDCMSGHYYEKLESAVKDFASRE